MTEASKPSCEAGGLAEVRMVLIISGDENKNSWHLEH
jgi:hypothetical protein